MMDKNRNLSKNNPYIHGLRGFAALIVFIFHIYGMSQILGVIPEDFFFPAKIAFVSLSCGVDIFFMISGYLISASLIRHANVRAFLLDRVIRIYPVFLFLHLCLFALAPLMNYKWLSGISAGAWCTHFISNLFLLPGVFDLPLLQLNAWSLSYEFAFYLFSASIYLISERSPRLSVIVLSLAGAVLVSMYPRAIFFAVGSLIFYLEAHGKMEWANRRSRIGIYLAVPFFAFMGSMLAANSKLIVLGAPLGFILFSEIVAGVNPFGFVLSSRIMQFLGTISYSFYLWHPVVTYPLKFLMLRAVSQMGVSAPAAVMVFGLVSLAITIPVSWISSLVLEKHCAMLVRNALREPVPSKA
jgi:peptidoglycan/LPS O-acetylase OafA/YrhL